MGYLGTASILVFRKGKGIVPKSLRWYIDKDTNRVIAVGQEARRMGKNARYIVAVRPLKEGVIADYETTEKMLTYFIRKVVGKRLMFKPRIIVCGPPALLMLKNELCDRLPCRPGPDRLS